MIDKEYNPKIVNDDEATFRIIVKRSDLKKAEDLYNKGKLGVITFDRKDAWSACYVRYVKESNDECQLDVWPTVWGYWGYKDGWRLSGSTAVLLARAVELGGEIQAQTYGRDLVEIEVDEDN